MGSNGNGRFVRFRGVFFGLVSAGAALTAACSGGTSSSVAPISAPSQAPASLPAALATGCIGASPSQQTTALPAAGGVTGTLTVGPLATPAGGCAVSVLVATGADATLTAGSKTVASRRRAVTAQASPAPSPLAQVELSTTTTSVNWLAVTFAMPTSVPAGSYPATVTTSVDLGDGQTYTTTLNYTLTVGPNGNASLTGINVTLGNYSAGLLSIYPSGTVLPTPAPTPTGTPSATPSPNGSATPTPLATATPTPQPTATATYHPTPSPTPSVAVDCFSQSALAQCGSYVTSGYYDGPSGYYSPSPSPGTSSPQPLYNQSQQGNPEGTVNVPYYWFVGTVTIQLPFFAPGYAQTMVNDCPSTVSVEQSGPNNDTYTVTFPDNGAQFSLGPNGASCLIYAEAPSDQNEPSYVMSLEYPGGTIEGVRRR